MKNQLISLLLIFSIISSQAQTYIQGSNLIEVPVTTATAAGTTTLVSTSKKNQQFTGSTTQSVVLPNATGLQVGRPFYFSNRSTGTVTIKYADATTALTLLANNQAYFILESNSTSNGTWDVGGSQAPLAFSAPLVNTSGTVSCNVASGSQPGCLSSADWTTFNGKQNALTIGNLTDAGTDGIIVTSGAGSVIGSGTSLAQHVADSTHNGYLNSTDWSTFNGKQASGNYITALTGDVTASGPGSVAATAAATQSNITSIPNLATVGTITSGTWSGATIALNKGGTGQTTKAPAFDALQPMTTGGDLIYGGASGTGTRLANGTVNQYLASAGSTSAPVWTSFVAPTKQVFTSGSAATYTLPTSPRSPIYIRVYVKGGGGGGGGSGTTAPANHNGASGTDSVFGTVTGTGGTGAPGTTAGYAGASGGGGSGGDNYIIGATGQSAPGNEVGIAVPNSYGTSGGGSGAGQAGSNGGGNATNAQANSGGGGGGAGGSSTSYSAAGGGEGGIAIKIIASPSATYTYTVGGGGAGGTAGTAGGTGGNGGSGYIVVEEMYQ